MIVTDRSVDWLAAASQARPDGLALIAAGEQLTYAQLNARTAGIVEQLIERGVERGDHIGVLMSNSVPYLLLIHALMRLGVVLVPLNTRLTPDDLRWQIEHAGCRAVIVGEAFEEPLLSSGLPTERVLPARTLDWTTHAAADSPYLSGEVDRGAVQAIVFTSGTSGRPKGAQITVDNLFWNAVASAWRLGTLPEDRWLLTLPLYHVGGLAIVTRCCLATTTIVLSERFDPAAMWDLLEAERITQVSLVPTMLLRLLDARPDTPFPPTLRLILLGGAAATPELIARCERLNVPVATTYGLTEATSQVATMLPADVYRKPGSVGKPLMFASVRVVGEDGASLPPGEYGEIVVSGPTIMRGYLAQPDDLRLRDGEFHTGDIGYLDADGDLWLVQRRSDLIVSGGENVYPAEVEAVLRAHPAVADVCVVGVPNAEWGQQVAAAVVTAPDQDLTADELDAFARERLAGYKRPRRIHFFEALPQTASGKIHRRAIAELLARI
ncbi:MAG: o-succinylbenzoate--CoA ligase [Chloroflexi bacterium]|nr:o-succinylbenzoate--CoA ligase [Chloroflexota bacterium]